MLAGCGLRSPAGRYGKTGLAFDHLAGWTVVSDSQNKARTVVVEGPDHSVLTISVFPPNLDVSLDVFINAEKNAQAEAIKNKFTVAGVKLVAEADTTPTAPTERTIAGTKVSGVARHFTVDLLTAHEPHTSEYFLTRLGTRSAIFMDQVSDEARSKVNAGFQRIFDSVALGP